MPSYGLAQTAAPAAEPLSTGEARSWVRQGDTADDTLLDSLVKAARQLAEAQYGRQLVTATWLATWDGFPGYCGSGPSLAASGGYISVPNGRAYWDAWAVRLPRGPVQSVTSVQYTDGSGTLQTLDSALYTAVTDQDPAYLVPAWGQIWPVTRWQPRAVRVTFVAGYGAASAVPEPVRLALRLQVADWYERRGDGDLDLTRLSPAVQRLLMAFWNGGYD